MRRVLAILIAQLLSACNVDIAETFDSINEFSVLVYEGGYPVHEYKIEKGSDKYKKLKLWFKNNEGGWEQTLVTYAPGVLVSGDALTVNFSGKSVIINNLDGQFSKSIKVTEYEFLEQ